MIVQIYGVTTVDDAVLVAELGADHVGVVPESRGNWDGVTRDEANAIVAALPDAVTSVVLSLATEPAEVLATIRAVPGAFLHVVRTDVLGLDALHAIREESGTPLMATVAVDDAEAVERARAIAGAADVLLLDSRDPKSGTVGASGQTHDWSLSTRIVGAVDVPVVLAGGLGPDNVDEAIAAVAPWGVDSETRTSSNTDRRRKDPERVRRFVERARRGGSRS